MITEIFADDQGSDAGREWFELYNATSRTLDLDGIALVHSRADGSAAHAHRITALAIAPGQYLTVGNSPPDQLPPFVAYGYGADLGALAASSGRLAVTCGSTEIDSVIYDRITPGHARELTAAQPPDARLNDDPASWCDATASEFATGDYGTPGGANDCEPIVAGQCRDGGALRDIVSPAVGDLAITEVMPSPTRVADATGEWFEVAALRAFDLNGLGLDRRGDASAPDVIASADCVHVAAGERVVFARSADPAQNGGLPAVRATFRFSLVGSGDVAVVAGGTVLDAIAWSAAPDGKALALDPAHTDPVANDAASNFCPADTPYGAGDLGTPGAPNAPCPRRPAPGTCDEGGTSRPFIKPAAGQLAITEWLANPAGASDAQREWFELANTGTTAFDLNELGVGRIGAVPSRIASAACVSVPPGGVALLARSSDPALDGMLPAVDATFGFGLVDTGGDLAVSDGATVLDQVRWTASTSGVAVQRDPATGATCAATTPYGDGTNLGTPKTANPPCP